MMMIMVVGRTCTFAVVDLVKLIGMIQYMTIEKHPIRSFAFPMNMMIIIIIMIMIQVMMYRSIFYSAIYFESVLASP